MENGSDLRRNFYQKLIELKLLDRAPGSVRFHIEESPFSDENENDSGEFMVVGLIYLRSGPKRLEIRWKPEEYLRTWPSIRFREKFVHPSIDLSTGEVSIEVLKKFLDFNCHTTLVDIVRVLVAHFDDEKLDKTSSNGSIELRCEISFLSFDMMKMSALR